MFDPTPEQIEAAAEGMWNRYGDRGMWRYAPEHLKLAFLADARAALEAVDGAPVSGSTSDGYHTFDELYEYRMLYNAHAAHGWLAAGVPVVKSWRHSTGEACFGGGWFIVVATLPTGQVSNHYEAQHWGLFNVPEVELPPQYDGHSAVEAKERIEAALAVAPSPDGGKRVVIGKENRDNEQETWAFTVWEPGQIEEAREKFPGSAYAIVTVFGLPAEGESA